MMLCAGDGSSDTEYESDEDDEQQQQQQQQQAAVNDDDDDHWLDHEHIPLPMYFHISSSITDSVSREGNLKQSVARPSFHPSVRLFPLHLLNRLTFEHEFLYLYESCL